MKKLVNGKYIDLTPEEITAMQAEQVKAEAEYWQNVNYSEAVNDEIRKRYSVSQELAILRQRGTKPDEFAEYNAYCEGAKAFVKAKKEQK